MGGGGALHIKSVKHVRDKQSVTDLQFYIKIVILDFFYVFRVLKSRRERI